MESEEMPTYRLSDEKVARMMVALRAGLTLRSFGITESRLAAYFKDHQEYEKEAWPLIQANASATSWLPPD
jgi:hypothetical protein